MCLEIILIYSSTSLLHKILSEQLLFIKQILSFKLSLKAFSFSFLPSFTGSASIFLCCPFHLWYTLVVTVKRDTKNLPPFLHPIQLLIPPSFLLLALSFFLSYLILKISVSGWLLPLTMSLTHDRKGRDCLHSALAAFHPSSVLQTSSSP